jgi:hypothetical protein
MYSTKSVPQEIERDREGGRECGEVEREKGRHERAKGVQWRMQ